MTIHKQTWVVPSTAIDVHEIIQQNSGQTTTKWDSVNQWTLGSHAQSDLNARMITSSRNRITKHTKSEAKSCIGLLGVGSRLHVPESFYTFMWSAIKPECAQLIFRFLTDATIRQIWRTAIFRRILYKSLIRRPEFNKIPQGKSSQAFEWKFKQLGPEMKCSPHFTISEVLAPPDRCKTQILKLT